MSETARFPRLDASTAIGAAADRLVELETRHGQVGSMVATMANSPTVVAGLEPAATPEPLVAATPGPTT